MLAPEKVFWSKNLKSIEILVKLKDRNSTIKGIGHLG
jgi:hypothetical protein